MSDKTVDLGIEDLTDAVEVGAGGFGTVYRARQQSLRRDVAVKMVANTVKDEKVRIRFEREIQAMGMLSGHPNIVTVYDSGFTGTGQPYILMDFMERGSLADRLEGEGPLPYPDVLNVMVQVCGALETAHQAGILHRDIKPENVLVSAYGEPKLGDFGIARLKGGPETGTASLTASIEHVAPELLEAKQPSPASDIYALGSTMFKLLTGHAAFVHPTDESIVPALTRIRDEPVPDLRQRGVPDPVADVVEKAMAKDPADRYPSAAAMGGALRAAQRALGIPQTPLPVRAEDAAAARESTRTLNSDDIAASIEDIRTSGPTPTPPVAPGQPTGPATGQPFGHPSGPQPAGHPSGPLPAGPGPAPGRPAVPPTGPSGPQPYGPGPQRGYVPPPQPPGGGAGVGWGKVAAGVGVVALLAVVGVAVALSGGDPEPQDLPSVPERTTAPATDPATDPAQPTDPPTQPPAYAAYETLLDDSGQITVDVPRPWADVEGGPWIIDGEEVGQQITAAPDLEAFRTTWTTPGVIFGASQRLREAFTPEQMLDALDFSGQCTYEGRQPYSDAAYDGFRDDYSACGGTDTTYTIIAGEPPSADTIVLVQFQAVDDRDDEALQRVIDTFFILPDAEAPAEPAPDGQ